MERFLLTLLGTGLSPLQPDLARKRAAWLQWELRELSSLQDQIFLLQKLKMRASFSSCLHWYYLGVSAQKSVLWHQYKAAVSNRRIRPWDLREKKSLKSNLNNFQMHLFWILCAQGYNRVPPLFTYDHPSFNFKYFILNRGGLISD